MKTCIQQTTGNEGLQLRGHDECRGTQRLGWREEPGQPLRRAGRRGPSAQRPCFLGEVTAPLCGFLTGNRYLRWVFRKLNAQIRPQGAKETSGVSVRGTRGCPRPLPVLLHEQHQGHSGFGGHRPPPDTQYLTPVRAVAYICTRSKSPKGPEVRHKGGFPQVRKRLTCCPYVQPHGQGLASREGHPLPVPAPYLAPILHMATRV